MNILILSKIVKIVVNNTGVTGTILQPKNLLVEIAQGKNIQTAYHTSELCNTVDLLLYFPNVSIHKMLGNILKSLLVLVLEFDPNFST